MDAIQVLTALGTDEGRADPYPLYAALHELGEASWADRDTVLVTGYDAVSALLRDPGFRVSDWAGAEDGLAAWRNQPVYVQGADWILNLNPPRHQRIRSLIARAFTPRRIAGLEPAIGRIADELLDAMAERAAGGGAVEFMHDFACPLPVTVICELIGVPGQDRERFRPVVRDLTGIVEDTTPEQMPAINAAATELLAYFTGLAKQRRASPRDDLLSDLIAISDAADGRLSAAELLHNLTLLMLAGYETTTNMLGNGLKVVLDDPAAGRAARAGTVPPAAFVDEVLRFDSPVQLTSRVGYDTVVGGIRLRPGVEVLAMLGAANRDPRRFAAPDRFDPARRDGAPLSFGGGAHYCIGAALARLEGAVVFPRLLRRFPRIAAAGPPRRRDGFLLRGFDTLPVTLGCA